MCCDLWLWLLAGLALQDRLGRRGCTPVPLPLNPSLGSKLGRDYFFSLFKVASTVYVAYSVKQDLLHSFPTYSFNTNKCYSVSQKIPPKVFCHFFPNGWVFRPNFTHLLLGPIYAWLQIFIPLSPTITKLCHTKCDHPACVSTDGGHFEHIGLMVVALNCIKICSPAYLGTFNRGAKFGLKIPNCFRKNVRKKSGGIFLTHTVYVLPDEWIFMSSMREPIGIGCLKSGTGWDNAPDYFYVAAKATYIRLLLGQNGGFSALAP